MVTRSGKAPVPEDVDVVRGDVADADLVRDACRGAAVVYHCVNPPYHRWLELFPRIHTAIIEGVTAAGARMVMADNLYMYGRPAGETMTEETGVSPVSSRGWLRAAMAQELLDAHRQGRLEVAIGRASDYFGPYGQGSHMGDRVFYPLLAGKKAQVVGDPDTLHTYTYLPDIARALVTIGESDKAAGQVWHVPSPPAVCTRQYVELIADQIGTSPRLSVAPPALLAILSWFNPTVRAVREELYQFSAAWVMDDTKYRSAFGEGETPVTEAIATTVDWYRTHPQN